MSVIFFDRDRRVADDNEPAPLAEGTLARRFARVHANDLRYVDELGKWFVWSGTHWRPDTIRYAWNEAHEFCRKAAGRDKKTAERLTSKSTIAAVEYIARADKRLVATADQWDANPMLLNTPDGVIDLRTGKIRPARPEDYCTKITAVGEGDGCPRFVEFLHRVTGEDIGKRKFIQRMFGYALTGLTNEHALFFLYGRGANGKTVLLNTISGLMGNYHRSAPIEAFTASKFDRHPTELAALRGARLVTATETEEGRKWAESRIKQLTGGDRVSARFMRQDFFEFEPQFKLVIAGNHRPGLRSVDEAMRRRLHLLPFDVTIPVRERDRKLVEILKGEWSGILSWLIDGCLDWQERGLRPPRSVREATEAYFQAEDAIALWIEEDCERDANAFERTTDLFARWSVWAERAGEPVGTLKQFRQNIETRGAIEHRKEDARGYRGLRLK